MESPSPRDTSPVDVAVAARAARECTMVGQAAALARWVGSGGRPVTASRVLRRADVAAAGAALGVAVPARVRTAADVPVLHRPWSLAVGAGLIQISGNVAAAGPVLECWSTLDDVEVLDAWLVGVRAVCEAESDTRSKQAVAGLVFAFLEAVATRDCPDPQHLWHRVIEVVERGEEDGDWSERVPFDVFTKYLDPDTRDPFAGLVNLLGQLGAVTGKGSESVAVTKLGQWAVATARSDRPRQITADLSAGEVAEALADCVRRGADPWMAVRRWLEPRPPADAARELLTAAADRSAAARIAAGDVADGLGDQALSAWQAVAHLPNLAVHARVSLTAARDQGARLAPADARWLAVEFATAALEGPGPDEALTVVVDRIPGESLESRLTALANTGHPDAARVMAAVREYVDSGVTPSIDQVYQLKVGLTHWRPPIWRRVLVPATVTLGDLHAVIQILFGWDGDHLHLFEVGGRRYSDPFYDLDRLEMDDEETVRLREAYTGTTKKIRYEYDFGASWWHEITLEKVLNREPGAVYPRCTGFASDSPVEYWSEDDPQDAKPYDLAATNRRLARLGGVGLGEAEEEDQ
ncbi:MAG: plasmid pRiA4b ORF-3 family protein [Micromonosporaceae bacterium]|nr:plasmid pRiA4b ORF-3 family protein [Micromonosporaceae bacterium]